MALLQKQQALHGAGGTATIVITQSATASNAPPQVHPPPAQLSISQPVPQEASCHIADHIQVIFAGFVDQSKASVLHMSSLFHAFTLCQLWTVYLEQLSHVSSGTSSTTNPESNTMGILFEFWAKVTPCILQLVSHSKSPPKDTTNDFGQSSHQNSSSAKVSYYQKKKYKII